MKAIKRDKFEFQYRLNRYESDLLVEKAKATKIKVTQLVRQIIHDDINNYEIGQPLLEKRSTIPRHLIVNTPEYKKLEHKAALNGLPVSTYVRFLIMQYLKLDNPLSPK